MSWAELIDKKIIAFRGVGVDNSKTTVPLSYALFDDNETIMEFREQDPYDYHDCDNSARSIKLMKDAGLWKRMFLKELGFEEATNLNSPF